MAYGVGLTGKATKDLGRLDEATAKRIMKKLAGMAANAENFPHQALSTPYSGSFRLRIGDYRAIYQLDHDRKLVIVLQVGHRSEIYDK